MQHPAAYNTNQYDKPPAIHRVVYITGDQNYNTQCRYCKCEPDQYTPQHHNPDINSSPLYGISNGTVKKQ